LELERLSNLNRMHLCLLDGLRSPGKAADRLSALIRFADRRGYLWDVLEGRFLMARLAVASGDHQRARKDLDVILKRAREQGHALITADANAFLKELEG
jgi:hypothetical protein